jgi:hypothetical protein
MNLLSIAIEERLMTTDCESLSPEQRAITGIALLELFHANPRISRAAPGLLVPLKAIFGLIGTLEASPRREILGAMKELVASAEKICLDEEELPMLIAVMNFIRSGLPGEVPDVLETQAAMRSVTEHISRYDLPDWRRLICQISDLPFLDARMRSLCIPPVR